MLHNVPKDQQENYLNAYESLMDDFGIPEENRNELEEILYYFLIKFESAITVSYEREQSSNALRFLKEYQEIKNITTEEYKNKYPNTTESYNPLNEFLTVHIHSKFQKAKAVLDYYGIALDTIKFLYNKIRNEDHLVNGYLRDYPEIPPLSILKDIVKEIDFEAQYDFLENIRTGASDLNNYLKNNLASLVSRHRYRLIFELLYLCDVFKYIGKINKHEGRYYSLKFNRDNPYLPSTVSEIQKVAVINALFKNEIRSKGYKVKVLKNIRGK